MESLAIRSSAIFYSHFAYVHFGSKSSCGNSPGREFGYVKSYPVESLATLQVNKDVKPKVADNKWLQCCLCMPNHFSDLIIKNDWH